MARFLGARARQSRAVKATTNVAFYPVPCGFPLMARSLARCDAVIMRTVATILGLALVLAFAGCGGESTSSSSPGAEQNQQAIGGAQHEVDLGHQIEQAFLKLPGARRDRVGGVEWLAPGENPADLSAGAGCTLDVALTSPEMISTYNSPGSDDVVINPAGTAGAKIGGTAEAQPICLKMAAGVLKGIK
jgi:hypothetical protein